MFNRIRSRLLLLVGLLLALGLAVPSAFAAPVAPGPGNYDDQSSYVDYSGTWSHVGGYSSSIFYNGTTSYSNDLSAYITFEYEGDDVQYCTDKGPLKGIAVIHLDGVMVFYQDLYAPERVPHQCFTLSPPNGGSQHTLYVNNYSTHATRNYIALDRFIVL